MFDTLMSRAFTLCDGIMFFSVIQSNYVEKMCTEPCSAVVCNAHPDYFTAKQRKEKEERRVTRRRFESTDERRP